MNLILNINLKLRLAALLFTILEVACVVGCSSSRLENPDPAKNNKVAYNKDWKECQEDYPEAASGAYIKQWIGCMKLKGWK